MATISLSQGQVAVVDDLDFDRLGQFHWSYRPEREGRQGYAVRKVKIDGHYRNRYLHREIMNPEPGLEVIFRNHDRLDCRRQNLLVVTKEQARRHHRVRRDSSGLKGVRFDEETGLWMVNVYRNGKYTCVGSFMSRHIAGQAYEEALRELDYDFFTAAQAAELPAPFSREDETTSPAECEVNHVLLP